ncbi:MAG: RsmB/NOP family class I SAM-dependent RNA methyltransferase [Candidatus Poribacteria bacterium]|nr:RsmB/NOP family class I SAM-dependent RNA methyltransferase [Candidatus Poribacteria bacterium]
MSRKPTGEAAFEELYRRLFQDEYDALIEALTRDDAPILRCSPENAQRLQTMWRAAGLTWKPLDWHAHAVAFPPEVPFGETLPGYNERLFYPMNAASLIPVLALDPQPDDAVLDACAAPGGKALMIAERLGDGSLVANDTSPARRRRMAQTFAEYGVADRVEVWGVKGETIFKRHYGTYEERFDRILVDAPCSSEKHVLNSPKHLAEWSPSRIKLLSRQQVALLSGLFLALKPGGVMVYSTCALTPEENESVVAELLKKKGDAIELREWTLEGVPGQGGIDGKYAHPFDLSRVRRVMPHRDALDPMFVATFQKR